MGRAEGKRRGKGDCCFGQRLSSHPFWYGLLSPWVVLSDVKLNMSCQYYNVRNQHVLLNTGGGEDGIDSFRQEGMNAIKIQDAQHQL